MKTRSWILIIAAVLILMTALSVFILRPRQASLSAQIYSGGELLRTVSLLQDQTFTVTAPGGGSNTVEIRSGKIAVTQATCPDHYCMFRGFRNTGPSIICLPNALEIRFLGTNQVDLPLG